MTDNYRPLDFHGVCWLYNRFLLGGSALCQIYMFRSVRKNFCLRLYGDSGMIRKKQFSGYNAKLGSRSQYGEQSTLWGLNSGRSNRFFSSPKQWNRHRAPPNLIFHEHRGQTLTRAYPSSAEVQNKWNYTSISIYAVMMWTNVLFLRRPKIVWQITSAQCRLSTGERQLKWRH